MFWGLLFREREDAGARFRREHERFLTAALRRPSAYPSIPLRRVSEGGFEPLLARPAGRERAERWWSAAFRAMDRV